MSWHQNHFDEQQYPSNSLNYKDEISGESQMMEEEPYNSQEYNFDSQPLLSRGKLSNSITVNRKDPNSIILPTSASQSIFDCRRSRSKYASQTNPLIYAKLFKEVRLYETNQKRISQRFHQYKNLFPSLKDQQIIELVKDQLKQEKHKFQYSGKDPKKQYEDIVRKHCITLEIEEEIIKGYIRYEGDLQRICYELRSKDSLPLQKNTTPQMQLSFYLISSLPRQLQLILIVKIKASISKLEQFIKQKRLAKIFIPFNELELNQIAYRFLEVHKGKVYSMDKAFPIVSFAVIFSPHFIQGRIKINQKEAYQLYKFMVNVLSAVQSETFFKKEKFDINKLNCSISHSENLQRQSTDLKKNLSISKFSITKSQHASLNNNEKTQNNKSTFDEWYSSVVRFYLECGDWKKVTPKLLNMYGMQFKYFKWSLLQRKVESFLRVVYQLFLSKLTAQNNLLQYKKQLPLQSRIKFIHITTWRVHQPLLFMLFYFYVKGDELEPFHLKEIIDYLINNKDMLCSTKKEMPNNMRRDLQKEKVEKIKEMSVEDHDILEQDDQQKVIFDNGKSSKQYQKMDGHQKDQQKIELKQSKDKCELKQIKEDDALFPKPSYTLQQKLKSYKQMWRQQLSKCIQIKEQVKKQPIIWRKLQKITSFSNHSMNSQYQSSYDADDFMNNEEQSTQRNHRYEQKDQNKWGQDSFPQTKYKKPLNHTQYKKNYKRFNKQHLQQTNHSGRYYPPRQQTVSFNHFHQNRHLKQPKNYPKNNQNPNLNFDLYKTKSKKQFLQRAIRDKLKQKLNHHKDTSKRYSQVNDRGRKSDSFKIEEAYSQTIWCQKFYNFNVVDNDERKFIEQEQECSQLYEEQGQIEQMQMQLMDELRQQDEQKDIIMFPQQLLQLEQEQQHLSAMDSYQYLLEQDQQQMLQLNHHHQQTPQNDIHIST